MQAPAVLINLFEVPIGREQEFIVWWKRCSEVLQQEPGFIDAKLHQSLIPGPRFQFINIAHWETQEFLNQARSRHQETLRFPTDDFGKSSPAIYQVVAQY